MFLDAVINSTDVSHIRMYVIGPTETKGHYTGVATWYEGDTALITITLCDRSIPVVAAKITQRLMDAIDAHLSGSPLMFLPDGTTVQYPGPDST